MISSKYQRNEFRFLSTSYPCFILVYLFFLSALPFSSAFGKDIVTITSDNVCEIDKNKGTALLKGNVTVIKNSTGSSLNADNLFLVRDAKNGQLMLVRAEGNVKIRDREFLADGSPAHEVFITCDLAVFDSKENRVELKGSVRVESPEYLLAADRIDYNYKNELGKITEIPGKQVWIKLLGRRITEEDVSRDKKSIQQNIEGNAKEILLNHQSKKAILQGNVVITNTSDQSRFNAERAEVFFDRNDTVQEIIASGSFSMVQPGRISSADRAVIEYVPEIVTLDGNAYVKESDQVEINSSRIKMYIRVNKGIIQGVGNVPVKMRIPIE